MAKYLRLPSGVEAKFDDNVTYEQAIAMVRQRDPALLLTPAERKEKSGFGAALGAGWKQFLGATEQGVGEAFGMPSLVRRGEAEIQEGRQAFIPTSQDEVSRALEQDGVLSALGTGASKYVTEPIGGIIGRYGAPMAATAAASLVAPELTLPAMAARFLPGVVGAGTDLPAEFGENIERQQEVSPGAKVNMEAAFGASLLQSALVGFGLPGWGVLTKEAKVLMGNEAAALAKQVADRKISKEVAQQRINSTLRNVVEQSGIAAVAGTGMMVGTEAARRGQAGQEVFSPKALETYKEQMIGAAELGPLFGLMHGLPMRRSQMQQLEKAAEVATARTSADKALADAVARGYLGEQAEMFGPVPAGPKPQDVRYTPDGRRVVFDPVERAESDLQAMEELYTRRTGQVRTGFDTGDLGAASRAMADRETLGLQLEQLRQRMADADPQEQFALVARMKQQIPALKAHRAEVGRKIAEATAQGDEAGVQRLIEQHKQIGTAIEQIENQAREMRIVTPSEVLQAKPKLEKRLNALSTQIDTLTNKGEYDKLQPLVMEREQIKADLGEINKVENAEQAQQAGPQLDMFGFNDKARESAEVAWRNQQAREAKAKAEADAKAAAEAADKAELARVLTARQEREDALQGLVDKKVLGQIEYKIEQGIEGVSFKAPEERARIIAEINEGELGRASQRYLGLPASPTLRFGTREEALKTQDVISERLAFVEEKIRSLYGKTLESPGAKGLKAETRLSPAGIELVRLSNQRNELTRLQERVKEAARTPKDEVLAARAVYELTGEKTLGEPPQTTPQSSRPMEGNVMLDEALDAQSATFNAFREDIERLHTRDFLSTSPETATGTQESITQRATQHLQGFVDASIKRVEGYRKDRGMAPLTETEKLQIASRVTGVMDSAIKAANAPAKSNIRNFDSLMGRTTTQVGPEGARTYTDTPGVIQKKLSAIQAEFMPTDRAIAPAARMTLVEREKRQYEKLLTNKANTILKASKLAGLDETQVSDLKGYLAKTSKFQSTDAIRTEMAKLIERTEQGRPALEAPATVRINERNWRVFHESRLAKAREKEQKAKEAADERARLAVLAKDPMSKPEVIKAKGAADALIAAAEKYDRITAMLDAAKGKSATYYKGIVTRWEKAYAEVHAARDAWYAAKREGKDAIDSMIAYAKSDVGVAKNQKARQSLMEARRAESYILKAEKIGGRLTDENLVREKRVAEQKRLEVGKDAPSTIGTSVPVEITAWKKTEAGKRVLSDMHKNKIDQNKAIDRELASSNKRSDVEDALLKRAKARDELAQLNEKASPLREGSKERDDLVRRAAKLAEFLAESKAWVTTRMLKTTKKEPSADVAGLKLPGAESFGRTQGEAERIIDATKNRGLRSISAASKAAEAAANKLVQLIAGANKRGGKPLTAQGADALRVRFEALSGEVSKAKAALEKAVSEGLETQFLTKENPRLPTALQAAHMEAPLQKLAAISAKAGTPIGALHKEATALLGTVAETARVSSGAKLRGRIANADKQIAATTEKNTVQAAREAEQEGVFGKDVSEAESTMEALDIASASGINIDFRRHEGAPPAKGMNEAEARSVVDRANKKLPGALKIEVYGSAEQAPAIVRQEMERQGITSAKGAILSDGRIVVFAKEHATRRDLEETIAHEAIGHYGVDGVIGEAGMKALSQRAFAKGDAAFVELAQALGVRDVVLGISRATQHLPQAERQVLMLRELLAHTAETRGLERSMATKVKDFFKDIVAAVRSWFKRSGMDEMAGLSTGEVHKIIRDAHRAFEKNQLGAKMDAKGRVSFRSSTAVKQEFASANPEMVGLAGKLMGEKRSIKDRVFSNAIGLAAEIQFTDRFAGMERIARSMKEALGGVQMMYFLRAYDTRTNVVAETALRGARKLVKTKRPDGKEEWTYGARGTPSLKDITTELGGAKGEIGDANAVMSMFTTYMAAERAKNVGIEKLGLSATDMPALDKALAFGRGNAHFQKARKMYEEYNHGLLDFMQETGALSAEAVAKLKSVKDYIGYYREKDGYVVDAETNIRIGDLKNQPFLRELIGGNSPIVDFATSALQNTSLLTDLAMRNMATKSTVFTIRDLGFIVGKVQKGTGPAAPDVVRFKIHGEDHYARIKTEGTYMEDIPPELLVKGLEGVSTALPGALRLMQGPANLLRKGVTRNPVYALRQAIRDPWHAAIAGGVNGVPILNSMKELKTMLRNENAVEKALQEQGLLISQVFGGSEKGNQAILRDFVAGTTHWTSLMSKLDHIAIKGDASARVAAYNSYVKQGMSHMEASLAQLDMMNFTKKGVSPSMNALSMMIPFFNAQVVGLSTLIKSMRGTTLFADRVKVQEKLIKRGAMMAGLTLLYASLASDSDAYKNAKPLDRLMNVFVPIPGTNDAFKLPIPFEIGYIFKALPEAVLNIASGDEELKDVIPAIKWMAVSSVPGGSNLFLPQGLKPMVELATGFNLMTGESIVQGRAADVDAPYQAYRSTTELSKALGQMLGVSPIKIDHFIRGYTGSVGTAIASLANPPFAKEEKLLQGPSDAFVVGSMFQREDGGRWVDIAYDRIVQATRAQTTFKQLIEENKLDEAKAYAENNAEKLANASVAGGARQTLGDIAKQMRAVYVSDLPSSEKKAQLRVLQKARSEYAKSYVNAYAQ